MFLIISRPQNLMPSYEAGFLNKLDLYGYSRKVSPGDDGGAFPFKGVLLRR